MRKSLTSKVIISRDFFNFQEKWLKVWSKEFILVWNILYAYSVNVRGSSKLRARNEIIL